MKLTCMIIEDEPLARDVLKEYISTHSELTLMASYEAADKAFSLLQSSPPDILFLDIGMPGTSGLDLLHKLKEKPLTILTTANREYALEAYELGVIDYLVKPIRYERFTKSVNRSIEFIRSKKLEVPAEKNESKTTIAFKSGTKNIILPLDTISHIQGLKDYTIFFTNDKKYMVNGSIKTILQSLPADQFIRVHKSFIVAKRNIVCMQRNKIEFGEYQVPVGRVFRPLLEEIFNAK
jgi:DNA-binding LytR/AlgR family response regulator